MIARSGGEIAHDRLGRAVHRRRVDDDVRPARARLFSTSLSGARSAARAADIEHPPRAESRPPGSSRRSTESAGSAEPRRGRTHCCLGPRTADRQPPPAMPSATARGRRRGPHESLSCRCFIRQRDIPRVTERVTRPNCRDRRPDEWLGGRHRLDGVLSRVRSRSDDRERLTTGGSDDDRRRGSGRAPSS